MKLETFPAFTEQGETGQGKQRGGYDIITKSI